MYSLVVFAIVIVAAAARPGQLVSVSQDTLGNYNLKYAIDGISRVEQRHPSGLVVGGYSYIDPLGQLRKISFVSGEQGFLPVGSDIPVPVQDTPEVARAKAEHLAVLQATKASLPAVAERLEIPHVPVVQPPHLEIPQIPIPAAPVVPVARLNVGTIPYIAVNTLP